MELPVYNLDGERIGTHEIADEWLQVEMNIPLMHQVVVAHLANKRQGTHSTKTRGEVRGGGRKPWSQKGTGRARQGSIRAPQWVGGGIVHGPKPNDYDQKINKRVRKTAIRMAWAMKVREGQVFLVQGLDSLTQPKTKLFKNLFDRLGLTGWRILLLLPEKNEAVLRSVANLPGVDTLPVLQPSAYDLLVHQAIVTTPEAFALIAERRLARVNVR